jgi:PilZ domain
VPLRRLRDRQPVVLDLEEEAIECTVANVAGGEATLEPVSAADAGYIPSLGRAAALVFAGDDGGRVRVAGAVRRGPDAGTLRFAAGAQSGLPARRRTPRTTAELPIAISSAAPSAEVHRLVACDVSLGGVGVRAEAWAPPVGELVAVAIELPAAAPIRGAARVLRVEDGVAGLEWVGLSLTERARLAAFLLASRAA